MLESLGTRNPRPRLSPGAIARPHLLRHHALGDSRAWLWEVLGYLSSGAFGVYSVVVLGRCGLLVEASRSVSALLRVGGGGPSKA